MSGDLTYGDSSGKGWVVFSGQADLPWLRLLKPGFRHCFVVLHDGKGWLTVDPMLHHMDVHSHHHLPADFDLPGWLAKRGQKVIEVPLERSHVRPAPISIFTCVEVVKRILGIHARRIFTPWQLYHYLTKKKGEN